jgi:hypothetical protein
MSVVVPRLEFASRAKVRRTDYATLRRFPSQCGRYVVEEVTRLYGPKVVYWLAIKTLPTGEMKIGDQFRSRSGAENACNEHARDQ